MLDDLHRENGPDEGEYHFSDEGVYDAQSGEEAKETPTVTQKSGLQASFSSTRRFVVLGAVFAGILLVVYLVLTPSTTPPPTDIMAESESPAPAPVQTAEKTENKAIATKTQAALEGRENQKVIEKAKPELALALNTPAPEQAPPVQSPEQSFNNLPPGVTPNTLAQPPSTQAPPAAPNIPATGNTTMDRLSALEESNNRMISQLNADYARKLAEFETQDKILQEQVRSLNAKISSMEAVMSHMMENQGRRPPPPSSVSPSSSLNIDNSNGYGQSGNAVVTTMPPMVGAAPKLTYSVQAIIPGRAWLKNESGDTITVAEGDLLRGLGRVIKIDPYDGTIQIDIGSKVLTLTYGNGDYA